MCFTSMMLNIEMVYTMNVLFRKVYRDYMILDFQIKICSLNENKIAYYLIKFICRQSICFFVSFFFLQKSIKMWICEKIKPYYKSNC